MQFSSHSWFGQRIGASVYTEDGQGHQQNFRGTKFVNVDLSVDSVCLPASDQVQAISQSPRLSSFLLFRQNINHSCHGRHFSCQTLSPQQSQQARHHRALQHSLQPGYVHHAGLGTSAVFIQNVFLCRIGRKWLKNVLTAAVITSESCEWSIFFWLKFEEKNPKKTG